MVGNTCSTKADQSAKPGNANVNGYYKLGQIRSSVTLQSVFQNPVTNVYVYKFSKFIYTYVSIYVHSNYGFLAKNIYTSKHQIIIMYIAM